ncbi:MAG: Eco57I restriction-modification methylase domain-containing protein [Ignavibacteria bacterium]|nr:Eco57I restriction-modification methylase domain-containing protein [Ignavibacteria bacterium]
MDPACGSGAFLNQAFDYLFAEGQQVNKEISSLKLEQREIFELDRHILTNNLFGVDLNPESVEITKLSLWLKTARKDRELTALDENIKCGNSLISDASVAGERAFDWEKEYAEIMKGGGFDVIIGNPPYIPTEEIPGNQKEYYPTVYKSAFGRINIYPIFYEKAITLVRKEGLIGFITPYTISKNKYYIEARRIIVESTWIKQIVDFQDRKIFEDATVDSIIIILQKTENEGKKVILLDNIISFDSQDYRKREYNQFIINSAEDLAFIPGSSELLNKVRQESKKVSEVINFNQGIITGDNKKFVSHKKGLNSKPVITGRDFNRYSLSYSGLYVEYTGELHRPRTIEIFEVKEKILLRQTGSYPICTIDTNQYYTLDTVHNGIAIDTRFHLKYLVCLLNSKLLRYIYTDQIKETGKVFAQVKIMYINE